MIDKELVEACYQAILGRSPDNDTVVGDKIKWVSSPQALIRDFLESAEFQNRLPKRIAADYFREAARIDVDVSDEQIKALFGRLQKQWREIGGKDPFWSVYTHDEYLTANINDAALDRLYETGAEHANLIDLFCARNQIEIRRGVCVELGCGVGRVTKHLAKRFEKVIAVDISEGNLSQCKTMAKYARLSNIECVLLQSPDQLSQLPEFDVFYSTIVLQHNPPPIQKCQLDILLKKLRHGGGFLFQTQTYDQGYEFSIEEYLASDVETMDMHSLPMHEILGLIEKHGHSLREVAADMWTGRYGSHTFFGTAHPRKRGLLSWISN